jgi:hypothetical protein
MRLILPSILLAACTGGQSGTEPPTQPGRCDVDHTEAIANYEAIPDGIDYAPRELLEAIGDAEWSGMASYFDGASSEVALSFAPSAVEIVRYRYVVLDPEAEPLSCVDHYRVIAAATLTAGDRISASGDVAFEDGALGTRERAYVRGAIPEAQVTGSMAPPSEPGTYELALVGFVEGDVLDAQTYWNNTEAGEPGGTRQVVGAELDLTR